MGCHRRLCYARLLNRSGFGAVMPFVIHVPYRYLIPKSTTPVKLGSIPFSISAAVSTPRNSRVPPLRYKTPLFNPTHKNKSLASPSCILHRSSAVQSLPISVFHPRSTRSRLACSSRTSFHKLHSFWEPPAVRRAALFHVAALKAVFTKLSTLLSTSQLRGIANSVILSHLVRFLIKTEKWYFI